MKKLNVTFNSSKEVLTEGEMELFLDFIEGTLKSIRKNYKEELMVEKLVFTNHKGENIIKFSLIKKIRIKFLFWENVTDETITNRLGNKIYFDSLKSLYKWLLVEYSEEVGFFVNDIRF